jgi:hypothetical protein
MKKKLFVLTSGCIVIIILIIITIYCSRYHIEDNKVELKESIKKITNISTDEITVLQELYIDNKMYLLLKINGGLGEVELTKGINNKYKIENVSHGTNIFRHNIIETNKGKYLILSGENIEMKINYINVYLDDKEYTINIPQNDKYYIAYCKVPNEIKDNYIEINKVKFFDSDGIDITDSTQLNS